MANIKHVVSATSTAIVTSADTVSNLFEWANEAVKRNRIEALEGRKAWAANLMAETQKSLQTATTELTDMGFTAEEIESEVSRITSLFNKK